MKPPAERIHVFRPLRVVQRRQHDAQFRGVMGLNACLSASTEKASKPLWRKILIMVYCEVESGTLQEKFNQTLRMILLRQKFLHGKCDSRYCITQFAAFRSVSKHQAAARSTSITMRHPSTRAACSRRGIFVAWRVSSIRRTSFSSTPKSRASSDLLTCASRMD